MKFHKYPGRKILRIIRMERYYKDKSREEEETEVTALIKKLNNIVVPPAVARQLGLAEDWKSKVSSAFVNRVAETAVKREKVLKELSKY